MAGSRIVAIVGVTASGKTDVAERVAAAIGGEVVCADSRQVYRELEIGTGKPTPAERAARPHHLFEELSLGLAGVVRGTAGWYAGAAREAVAGIRARAATPVLVGGSGLYLRAASRGLAPLPASDPAIRRGLQVELEGSGSEPLHRRLAEVDPASAARLAPRDAQRIVRALEVYESTGHPLSWWHAQRDHGATAGEWRSFELRCDAALLRERIASRTREMFRAGLVEETRALIERGLAGPLAELHAVGYDEAAALIEGRLSRADAEARTSLRTAQLAKRQRTWFRHQIQAEPIAADSAGAEEIAQRIVARLRDSG